MTIMTTLFRHLDDSKPEFRLSRLIQKFVENDNEKVARLIELLLKYRKKLTQCEEEIAQEREVNFVIIYRCLN